MADLLTNLLDFVHDLFVKPIPITGTGRLLMLVPLALMVSVVYRTIRCERLRSVPLASLSLCFMIVTGMLLIGVVLLAAYHLLAA
ncbi:MAG: hypothetical protein MI923_11860 [Phycisphaerales bacterium]|nr:hypothetical protein [Phycisphaerales bacterium]